MAGAIGLIGVNRCLPPLHNDNNVNTTTHNNNTDNNELAINAKKGILKI